MNIRNSIRSLDSEICSCESEIRSCDAESGSAEIPCGGLLADRARWIPADVWQTGIVSREYHARGSETPSETRKAALGYADTITGDSAPLTASGGVW